MTDREKIERLRLQDRERQQRYRQNNKLGVARTQLRYWSKKVLELEQSQVTE